MSEPSAPSPELRRFAGHVAHDLNNLLSAVVGYGELLRNGLPAEHPLRAYADDLMVATQRGCTQARSLAALGGRIPARPQRIATDALAHGIVAACAGSTPAVALGTGKSGQVLADPEVLAWAWRQVLNQLQGVVSEGAALHLTPRLDGISLALQRSLSPTEAAALFACHVPVPPSTKGGLGVAVLATIAEQSGGRLGLTGSGSRTALTLSLPTISATTSDWAGQTVLLLVGDDDLREQAEHRLLAAGAVVLAAENAAIAAGLVRVYGGSIDAVVADPEAVIPTGVTARRTSLAALMA
jgi:hypothetical protein